MKKNNKCITCDTDLKKEELPENKGEKLVLPFHPTPIPYECFICYCNELIWMGLKIICIRTIKQI